MTVVVGGHSRNIGKTSVLCGIVAGLRHLNWTAVKITQYGHHYCSREDEACHCFDPKEPVAMTQEPQADPTNDSGRYLAAGAKRAFWLRTPTGRLAEGLPLLREVALTSENLIVESNSLLGFLRPDLYVMVVDGTVADFKPSASRFFDRASVVVSTSSAPLGWPEVPPSLLADRLVVPALGPSYTSPALVERIQAHFLKLSASSAD